MANWLGTGTPKLVVQGTAYTMPENIQGGRVETWDPEVDETWFNLAGDVIEGDLRFRFKGEYTWATLTEAQVQNLLTWRNQRQHFSFLPYSDVSTLVIVCRIAGIEIKKGGVVGDQDVLVVKIESTGLYSSVPIPDLSVVGARGVGLL